jgi:hypothetical protein
MNWSREEVFGLSKVLSVLIAILAFHLIGAEPSIVLGMVVLWTLAVCALTLYFRQDYIGKNSHRLCQLKLEFGTKYSFSLLFGQLYINSKALEPTEDDAVEMAKILWIEAGQLRKGISQYAIPVSGTDGKRRFYILRALAQDGSESIFTAIPVGSWWAPTLEPTRLFFLEKR